MEDLEQNSIKRFRQWAPTYESPFNRFFFSVSNRDAAKFIDAKKGAAILDVGCGTGLLIERLLKEGDNNKIWGIDISAEMIGEAKKKFGKNKNVTIELGSATKLPYKDNFFDYVTCVHSFHHYPSSLQSLKELTRVAKKGGRVIILDGVLDGGLRQWFWKRENRKGHEGKVFRYTREQMREMFKSVGLKNIEQHFSAHFSVVTAGVKV